MQTQRRIVFKLSGEMLAAPEGTGIDLDKLAWIADEIKSAHETGCQVAFVVGAGNFVRGSQLAESGVGRATADYMGMLGTVINALALGDSLARRGVSVRVMSAISMEPAAESYERAAAVAALERGEVLVFAAGTGNPYFTTDTAASLRAIEVDADLLAKATKVDGVFDKDPVDHPDAKLYKNVSYDQVLAERLGVMDATAVAMCRDHQLPVLVFRLGADGGLQQVAAGKAPGTLMA